MAGEVILHHSQRRGIEQVAYGPDGRSVASLCRGDRTTKVWDADTGQLITTIGPVVEDPMGPVVGMDSMAYSPDSHRLATGLVAGRIKLWDAATARELLTLGHDTGIVRSVAFSGDGRQLVSYTEWGERYEINVWDLQSGREVLGFGSAIQRVHMPEVQVAFSPDGRRIYGNGPDWIIRVWDAATGQELHDFGDTRPNGSRMALSPDGKRIATRVEPHRYVKVWDARTGQEMVTLRPKAPVWDMIFSQDGTRLAAVSAQGVLISGCHALAGGAWSRPGR